MLYLIDKPLAELAYRTAEGDDDARAVLVQDGVLLDPPTDVFTETFAVARDVEVRGVSPPSRVEAVPYERVVELTLAQEVRSFV